MKLILSVAVGASLVCLARADVAKADWLDDAWSEWSVRTNGNPAITLHRDSIYVVLPIATLLQAHEEGISTEGALHEFLERYGQRCSDLVDLNVAHPNLRVSLSLQSSASFDVSEKDDDLLTKLKTAYHAQHFDSGIPLLFTVSSANLEVLINYVPSRQIRCVAPGVDLPTS